jgi:hypothetical protein
VGAPPHIVITGLDPVIHEDGRISSGHDELGVDSTWYGNALAMEQVPKDAQHHAHIATAMMIDIVPVLLMMTPPSIAGIVRLRGRHCAGADNQSRRSHRAETDTPQPLTNRQKGHVPLPLSIWVTPTVTRLLLRYRIVLYPRLAEIF